MRGVKRVDHAPTPNATNPYAVARKSAMQFAKVTATSIHRVLVGQGTELSAATVREVINGTFRNDAVITVFCELTHTVALLMWPSSELAWLAERRAAERSALEAAG
jgi:hypothetical protein